MLNRREAPLIHPVNQLLLPMPRLLQLDNGIPLYVLDYPEQEVLKVEVVFQVGRPQEQKHLQARGTSRMMREGTQHHSGAEVAEFFDYYGASLSIPSNLDTSIFALYSLSKYAENVIPMFAEVLHEPCFPEAELETWRRSSIQELAVELEKVETIAYRKITELIFGETHPYGYNSVERDYQAISREDLMAFFQQWYQPERCFIFASGQVNDAVIDLLKRHLGQRQGANSAGMPEAPGRETMPVPSRRAIHIPHPGSLQTAIKIGRRTFGRSHPDYNGLFVLNTVLGGYFGSRLMHKVREKQGFTYNIYSSLDAYRGNGCLYIASEVNPDKAAAAIRSIKSEMKKLREKPIEQEELAMVRNYLLGMLLNGLDGPLNSSDVVRGLVAEGLPRESFRQLVDTIRTITPEQLQSLAVRYLQPGDFWTITVG